MPWNVLSLLIIPRFLKVYIYTKLYCNVSSVLLPESEQWHLLLYMFGLQFWPSIRHSPLRIRHPYYINGRHSATINARCDIEFRASKSHQHCVCVRLWNIFDIGLGVQRSYSMHNLGWKDFLSSGDSISCKWSSQSLLFLKFFVSTHQCLRKRFLIAGDYCPPRLQYRAFSVYSVW